jgi:hypothetical protein
MTHPWKPPDGTGGTALSALVRRGHPAAFGDKPPLENVNCGHHDQPGAPLLTIGLPAPPWDCALVGPPGYELLDGVSRVDARRDAATK